MRPRSRPALIAALVLAGCRSAPQADTQLTEAPDAPVELFQGLAPRNVVVLHTDTLRWDHLPWYGYERQTLPLLSARRGWVRWERMYSTSGWTAPSTASLFTAQDIHHHGVRMTNDEVGDDLLGPVIADWYAAQGLATGLVSGNELFNEESGMTRGYELASVTAQEPLNAESNVEAALAWLDGLPASQPFLLHIQAFDPHAAWFPAQEDQGTWSDLSVLPFRLTDDSDTQRQAVGRALVDGSEADREALKASVIGLYDEELLGLDRALDRMIDELDQRGLLADTLIVFTADHGENLFDRDDSWGHGSALYEEQHRIPLLFYHPSFTDTSVDGCLASNVDLHPTLLRAMGLPLPEGIDGAPMQDQCRAFTTGSIYRDFDDQPGAEPIQLTVQTTEWKLLRACGRAQTLYDLTDDPGSLRPVDPAGAPVSALNAQLDQLMDDIRQTWPGFTCDAPGP